MRELFSWPITTTMYPYKLVKEKLQKIRTQLFDKGNMKRKSVN